MLKEMNNIMNHLLDETTTGKHCIKIIITAIILVILKGLAAIYT